jgi:DNA-binding transcriptional ArsR family regulator
MDSETNERASVIFSALGHPTRLQITSLLLQEGRSVNDVAAALNLAQSSTSQHLAILARAGVLMVNQIASTRIYSVRGPRIGMILELIERYCDIHNLKGPADLDIAEDLSKV